MPSTECNNCGTEFEVNLDSLEKTNAGPAGNHTTFYTYAGEVKCPACGDSKAVEYTTEECDETGDRTLI